MPGIDAERYERLECIGRGSFGDVYRGCATDLKLTLAAVTTMRLTRGPACRLDRETNKEVAIKVIDLEDV